MRDRYERKHRVSLRTADGDPRKITREDVELLLGCGCDSLDQLNYHRDLAAKLAALLPPE